MLKNVNKILLDNLNNNLIPFWNSLKDRNFGGFLRDIIKQDYESVKMRTLVMFNRRKDPFDTFDFILSI